MIPRIGDEVVISCEPESARVVEADSRQVTLEWPWGVIDDSSNFRWDGKFSLPYGDSNAEWVPYRLEPDFSELQPGDICTVSIPPTRLYVGHYEEYDSPRNLGWAPAPTAGIYVVPPENMDVEDAGCMLYLGGAEPISVEPVED
ncbi:hypothetical protein [Streptomyces cylindrosporus]|uniref:Uncharacterized protein n=1 Tax=Streptomyces cylindrosporus TaxID=2927583 RepID=A0ABS9Y5R0_9ACTN|nr:hypothetical protein [Streptomyces cylindrosporus]MCI3272558.1 hypothetical protein [Streptomyces cylindrosporus]